LAINSSCSFVFVADGSGSASSMSGQGTSDPKLRAHCGSLPTNQPTRFGSALSGVICRRAAVSTLSRNSCEKTSGKFQGKGNILRVVHPWSGTTYGMPEVVVTS
jgi:hypothetical protein